MLCISQAQARRIKAFHGIGSLLTLPTANAKLAKSIGYYNAGISFAQASLSGHNVCFGSTTQCRNACLGGTGRAEFTPAILQARINRTKLFATNPDLFWEVLLPELYAIDRRASKLEITVAFRPNILSDISWHLHFPQMFEIFSHWNFYGYTKVKSNVTQAIAGELPENYHMTYSWSERAKIADVKSYVASGINVAVPFYKKDTLEPVFPTRWWGLVVIDGDQSDLRFLDKQGVIVGLKTKLPKSINTRQQVIKESKGFFQPC
jgi:hypothetical protein